jgi:hypothetical protein
MIPYTVARPLAQILQELSLLQLRLQELAPLHSLPALAVAPHVEPVLGLPGVAAHTLNFFLDLVLGVTGITALRVDLGVVTLLGLTGVTSLRIDLLLEPLLGLTGVTAFSTDLDIEPLLSLPRIAALALHPALGLVAGALPLAGLPRRRSDTGDDACLIDNRCHGQRDTGDCPVLAHPVRVEPLRRAARQDPLQGLGFLGPILGRPHYIRSAADNVLRQVAVEEHRK